jgi:uroporphyrinogen decarboxylase
MAHTSADRIVAALTGKELDRPPVSQLFCGAARRVYGCDYEEFSKDAEIAAKAWTQAQKLVGFDVFVLLVDLSVEAASWGQEVQYFGNDTARPNYDNPVVASPAEYEKIANFPQFDPRDAKVAPRMAYLIEIAKRLVEMNPTVPVCGFVYCALGTLGMMRGAENMFLECMTHKEEVHAALKAMNPIMDEYTRAQIEVGVASVCLDVLFGSQTIMSKKMWEEVEGPYAQTQAKIIENAGLPITLHNCGNGPYFDAQEKWLWKDTDKVPFCISYADLPPDCKTRQELKDTYGSRFTLHGHVMPAPTLFLGTVDEVKAECKAQMDVYAPGGRYILASSCEFPPNGTMLNAIAMTEAANEWSYK